MIRSTTVLRSLSLLRPVVITTRSFQSTRFIAASKPERIESDLTHPSLLKDPPISNPSSETDPWSLTPPAPPSIPFGMEGLTMQELIDSPHPEGRDQEPTETLRKRLVYESRKRGILETDLILATFAKDRLGTMVDRELREYDRVRHLVFYRSLSPSPSRVSCERYDGV